MNYEDCLDFIYGLKRFGKREIQLDRMKNFVKLLGHPHEKMKHIQVTGTSGKGSTVAMISSILKEAGYTVGMFISPHLSSFTERISINKRKISKREVVKQVKDLKPVIKAMREDPGVYPPTFFEVTTGLMFKYFMEQEVDFAVLEVGLGGRLDATNVVDSLVSIITSIHLEHTHILGETIQEIAREKGGIIKQDRVAITAEQKRDALHVLKTKSREKNATFYQVGNDIKIGKNKVSPKFEGQNFSLQCFGETYEDLHLPLLGNHQLRNAALAIGSVKALERYDISIPKIAVKEGLRKTHWPGRLEIVQREPLVVLDCAKDPAAAKVLKKNVERLFKNKELTIVTSISSDKDFPSMIETFSKMADQLIITEHSVMDRATAPEDLVAEAKKHGIPYKNINDVQKAVKNAISSSKEEDLVLVTGSVFTVGEAREIWFDEVTY